MRAIIVMMLMACGPAPTQTPPCQCCWPVEIHGPNRCRFARAADAPPDPCELDPAQRCVQPVVGAP